MRRSIADGVAPRTYALPPAGFRGPTRRTPPSSSMANATKCRATVGRSRTGAVAHHWLDADRAAALAFGAWLDGGTKCLSRM